RQRYWLERSHQEQHSSPIVAPPLNPMLDRKVNGSISDRSSQPVHIFLDRKIPLTHFSHH
ncbi:hypothetical protein, partial [Chlorogloeopsis fritschii]